MGSSQSGACSAHRSLLVGQRSAEPEGLNCRKVSTCFCPAVFCLGRPGTIPYAWAKNLQCKMLYRDLGGGVWQAQSLRYIPVAGVQRPSSPRPGLAVAEDLVPSPGRDLLNLCGGISPSCLLPTGATRHQPETGQPRFNLNADGPCICPRSSSACVKNWGPKATMN